MSHSGTDYRPAETSGSVRQLEQARRGRPHPVVSFENVSKHYGNLKAVDGTQPGPAAG